VGTLCYFTGLKDPAHAALGPMGGTIMETAVLSEIIKALSHRGIDPQVYFSGFREVRGNTGPDHLRISVGIQFRQQ
jgi:hypothetical protein